MEDFDFHHFSEKTLFTKLHCSQVCHCVQMADPLSVQLVSLNFASRTHAYTRLAQGFNQSLRGFSSFVRFHRDSSLAANLDILYLDEIGCGVETFEQKVTTLRRLFDCLGLSRLRLTPYKCEFGMPSINFLGNPLTSTGLEPQKKN